MAVENNAETGRRLGGVTGKGFVPGQSGNPGGRPRALARMVREAVGEGADLIEFMAAVLKGDAKRLGVRVVSLRDRIHAAEWLTDRGYGKTIPVVDLPQEVPTPSANDVMRAIVDAMPPALSEQIRRELDAQFYAKIDAECAQAVAAARSQWPPPPIDIRDFVDMHRAECLTIPGVRGVTLSDSFDIILEVDAEVPDERLTWIDREVTRLLDHRILVKRRSLDLQPNGDR